MRAQTYTPLPTGEFPASQLILAKRVIDHGQLTPAQRADLDYMVRTGKLTKEGRNTYVVVPQKDTKP